MVDPLHGGVVEGATFENEVFPTIASTAGKKNQFTTMVRGCWTFATARQQPGPKQQQAQVLELAPGSRKLGKVLSSLPFRYCRALWSNLPPQKVNTYIYSEADADSVRALRHPGNLPLPPALRQPRVLPCPPSFYESTNADSFAKARGHTLGTGALRFVVCAMSVENHKQSTHMPPD